MYPVGEVGRVNQAERHGRQHFLDLASLGGSAHDGRRVPFREHGDQVLAVEPLAQQVNLRALAGAIDALDDDQLSRILPVVGMTPVAFAHLVRLLFLQDRHGAPLSISTRSANAFLHFAGKPGAATVDQPGVVIRQLP